jgi:hypothetical protein
MRLATFILASLALTAAFAPVTQGQDVRRAIAVSEDDRWFRWAESESDRLTREGQSINAQYAQLDSYPLTEQTNAARGVLVQRFRELGRQMGELAQEARRRRIAARDFKPAPTPAIDFQPLVPQSKPPDKNDCLIVATETYARLKKTAYWARIAGFDYTASERNAPGHAVVLFQPTRGSTVWLYDEAGSRDLGIKSHGLSELKEAISAWLKGDARVSDIRWIGEERELSWEEVTNQPPPVAPPVDNSFSDPIPKPAAADKKEFVGSESNRPPAWSSTTRAPLSEKDQTLIAILILVVTYNIFVVVVCFLKDKPGFAAAGIVWSVFALVGAVRIAKPNSWWSRKYYGPDKMAIALKRFTPQPVLPPPTPPLQRQQPSPPQPEQPPSSQPSPIANSTQENMQRTTKRVIAREWLTFVVLLVVGLTIVPLFLITISYKEVKLAMLPGFYEALFSRPDRAIGWLLVLAPYIIYQLGHSLVWAVKTAKGRSAHNTFTK